MSQKTKRPEQVKADNGEEKLKAINPEFSREDFERRELRRQFIKIAGNFLTDGLSEAEVIGLNDEELGEYIQKKFQKTLKVSLGRPG